MGIIQAPEIAKKDYTNFSRCGSGAFGTVIKCESKLTQEKYNLIISYRLVIKEVKDALNSWDITLYTLRELSILHKVSHPNIPRLMYFI